MQLLQSVAQNVIKTTLPCNSFKAILCPVIEVKLTAGAIFAVRKKSGKKTINANAKHNEPRNQIFVFICTKKRQIDNVWIITKLLNYALFPCLLAGYLSAEFCQ